MDSGDSIVMRRQAGFTLIEIMVSLFLSSIILIVLMQHHISIKYHYVQLETALDDAIDKQLLADLMRDSIHQAGFTPCLSIDNLSVVDRRDAQQHVVSLALEGNTVLRVNRMSPYFDEVLAVLGSTRVLATRLKDLRSAQSIVIADCTHAELHAVHQVSLTHEGQLLILEEPLLSLYQPPIYIGEWMEERFFVPPQGGLFYHQRHTDALSSQVTRLQATLDNRDNSLWVKLRIGFQDAPDWLIDARVRVE
jgi:prepilin-type N-terminal cleavage/methylation domain-containing protein